MSVYTAWMPKQDKHRAERLAAALRQNLRRRKAQVRDPGVAPAEAGASGPKNDTQ